MVNIIVGIILLVAAVFLTVAILAQEGKSARLSGAIAGSGDGNYLGKNKKATHEKRLSTITTVVAVCFTVLVLLLYILQPNNSKIDKDKENPADPDAVTSGQVVSSGEAE